MIFFWDLFPCELHICKSWTRRQIFTFSIFAFSLQEGFHWKSPSPIKSKVTHGKYIFRRLQRVSYLQNGNLFLEGRDHVTHIPSLASAQHVVSRAAGPSWGRGTCDSCSACPSFGTFWKTGDGELGVCLTVLSALKRSVKGGPHLCAFIYLFLLING